MIIIDFGIMKKILCIEDDFNSQLLLKMYFRRSDFDATIVSNGDKAVSLLMQSNYDFVLTDWNLHGNLSSDSLIESLFPLTSSSNTPLLVMTADHSLTKSEMIKPEYISKIIYKPITKKALFQELNSITSNTINSAF